MDDGRQVATGQRVRLIARHREAHEGPYCGAGIDRHINEPFVAIGLEFRLVAEHLNWIAVRFGQRKQRRRPDRPRGDRPIVETGYVQKIAKFEKDR
jgi:hypothetical protein